MRLFLLPLFSPSIITALPFVSTWKTTSANENIVLPAIYTQTNVAIDWGDSNSESANVNTLTSFSHTYALPGQYNVSIEGQFFWSSSTSPSTTSKMLDILSWGDGFLVNQSSTRLFSGYTNLRVSAPPNTQPVCLPGATLSQMFKGTSFNSSLDWDLANVTDLSQMFYSTPLNQPLTFRNTQGVTTISMMFTSTPFNQTFHFDASSLLDATNLFGGCPNFNQVVNLTNSSKLTTTFGMFSYCPSFNQPLTFNTDSVTNMQNMFLFAPKFNQPVNFNVSQVTNMLQMFFGASMFNQPINFQASAKLTTCDYMFYSAMNFNQPVVMDTSSVTNMAGMFAAASSFACTVNFTSTAKVLDMFSMFDGANWFTQDLSSWDTALVTQCAGFRKWCGLPNFPNCVPCDPKYTNDDQLSVCTSGIRTAAPSACPSSAAPSSAAPTRAPTRAPTTRAPTRVCQGFRRCYDCALAGCKWVQTQTTVGCVAPTACTENAACIAKQAKCPESQESPSFCTGYCRQTGRSGCSCAAGCAGSSCCRDFNYSCPP